MLNKNVCNRRIGVTVFFIVRNNCSALGKWLAWTQAECLFKGSASSHFHPGEMRVCLPKLFYVALSWRQIRPHERAIMPPLVAAALRISASLPPARSHNLAHRGEKPWERERGVRRSRNAGEVTLNRNTSERHLAPLSSSPTLLSCWETRRHKRNVLVFGSTFITLWQGLKNIGFHVVFLLHSIKQSEKKEEKGFKT